MANNVTDTKVLCKDGSYGIDKSSVDAKYDNSKTCINNGGRAENQTVVNAPLNVNKDVLTSEDKFYEKLGIKYYTSHTFSGLIESRVKGRFLVAVVLVGGYFIYKKFNK